MVRKSEERKDMNEEKIDVFKVWADSYTGVLKMWGDSHLKLYKPWIESMGDLSEKAASISQDAMPEKYREFYDEWLKTYQNTFGKFYSLPNVASNKEMFDKLLSSAEGSNRLYKAWISQLEENSKKTRELIKGEQDAGKYKECYNMWMKSYEKMFDEMLELPAMENTRDMFEEYTGIPDIYSATHAQMSKLWKDSYARLYRPWIESMLKLSEKFTEISRGKTGPEAYKEFYDLWMSTYQDNYNRLLDGQSAKSSKEVFENFLHSTNIYLNMYKSWITALEKMSEKSKELAQLTNDPEAYREFCDLWIKMYEKAFDSFFEDMPMVGPMKETMEPVKVAAKTYADAYVKMSRMCMRSNFNPGNKA